jgi:hypothetical protein
MKRAAIILFLALFGLVAAAGKVPGKKNGPNFIGKFTTGCFDFGDGTSMLFEIDVSPKIIQLYEEQYDDSACSVVRAIIATRQGFQIEGKSDVLEGAWNVAYKAKPLKTEAILYSQADVDAWNGAGCSKEPVSVNTTFDATRCISQPDPSEDCPLSYDLFLDINGTLFWGDQSSSCNISERSTDVDYTFPMTFFTGRFPEIPHNRPSKGNGNGGKKGDVEGTDETDDLAETDETGGKHFGVQYKGMDEVDNNDKLKAAHSLLFTAGGVSLALIVAGVAVLSVNRWRRSQYELII